MKKFHIFWKTAAGAGIVTAAMLILTVLAARDSGMNSLFILYSVLASVGAGLFLIAPFRIKRIGTVLLAVVLPAAALCTLECYTHVPQDLTPKIFFLNLLFYWILYGICTFAAGSVKIGYPIATLVPMLFGLVNYYVVQFRGTPIVPWDLLSLRTAVSVADNYEVRFAWKTVFVLMGFIWIILLAWKTEPKIRKIRVRIPAAAAFLLMMFLYISQIQIASVQKFWGMDTILFTLNVLYRNNGIAGGFLGNLRFLHIDEPKGYSSAKVEELMDVLEEEDGQELDIPVCPNIIVIMNEAFSDLSVYGDIRTNQEVMPFFHKMQEEAVGGELYVSVKGGNTANTEFEFLTGDSMAFLPTGSIPYQQYLNTQTPSLASYLKTYDYSTLAIHPYRKSGWDRDQVYEYFGFDEFLGQESFKDPLKYRSYISDQTGFEKIIEKLETNNTGNPMFVFEVTMQNHGGYSKDNPDFDIYVHMDDVENKTTGVTATEKYLTLMNMTDKALEELVHYLEEQGEPSIILMFGDHQPSDYITNVVRRVTGNTLEENLDSVQDGYRVPFVMWSNYGLEHEYYDGISVNYLGGILMKHAGLPLTDYQKYLNGLKDIYPVVNGNVYRDTEGVFHSFEEEGQPEEITSYQMLQYNHLVDTKKRVNSFFGVNY